MSRKGQSTGLNFFVILILAVAAVVLIILGYYKWFAPISDLPGALPSSLSAKATFCKTASGSGFGAASYCGFGNDALIVSKKKQWINCEYIKRFFQADYDVEDCGTNAEKSYCASLDDEKAIVNGQTCKLWIEGKSPKWKSEAWVDGAKPVKCTDSKLGGTWSKVACPEGKEDITSKVTNNEGKDENIYCCK